jgi:CNT family concentrative nucleoside transporter
MNFLFSLLIWFGLTGFLCSAYSLQIPKGYNQELLVLGVLYVYITLYLVFCHVSTSTITRPYTQCTNFASDAICNSLGPGKRTILYAAAVIIIITATVFSFPEKNESPRLRRLISLFGIFVFIFGTYASSKVSAYNQLSIKAYA